jgi:hypothetical protein
MPDPFAGRHAELAAGLAAGAVAALLCLAIWAVRRRRRPGVPVPVAGAGLAAAGAAALAATGGFAARPGPGPLAWGAAAAVAAGVLLADFDHRRRADGLTTALLAVTAAGVWATVPDVEAAVVVLGASLPFALLGWPLLRSGPPSLGPAGALAVAGLLAWAALAGGAGRPGSWAGALACLGVLAAEPLAGRLDRRGRPVGGDGGVAGRAGLLGAHLLLVAVAARVVGRPASLAAGLALAAALLAGAVAATVWLRRRRLDTSASRRST